LIKSSIGIVIGRVSHRTVMVMLPNGQSRPSNRD
jgi:hypothetical protein